jgi:hypothetical protein
MMRSNLDLTLHSAFSPQLLFDQTIDASETGKVIFERGVLIQ